MIIPFKNKIQIEVENIKAGGLKTEVKTEVAKVLAIGNEVSKEIKPGDRILVKAWAIDIFPKAGSKGEDLCFVSEDNDAICGIIRR